MEVHRNFSPKPVSNNSETLAGRIGGPPRTLRQSAIAACLPRYLLCLLETVNLPLAVHRPKDCLPGNVCYNSFNLPILEGWL